MCYFNNQEKTVVLAKETWFLSFH